MLRKLRTWIKNKLFADDVALYKTIQSRLERDIDAIEDRRRAFEQSILKLTVTDLVREQLKGFNPHLLDRADSTNDANILNEIESEDGASVESFLAECHDIAVSDAFKRICKFVIRNQVLFTAKESRTEPETNFGRATINGVDLIRQEVEDMNGIWEERKKAPETFDEHEVM